jgi:hypothetical protein
MIMSTLTAVAADLRGVLAELEPERLDGPDAAALLTSFAEIERLAAAGKLLSARRVESSNIWRARGHRSAAAHVAETTGTGIGPALDALATARRMRKLPSTEEAARDGALSERQLQVITDAASAAPGAEQELIDAAQQQPMSLLKLRARRAKAASDDHSVRYEQIRSRRYLKHWTDRDGAVRFDALLTPDAGAQVIAAIRSQAARLEADARGAGSTEPKRVFDADALVALANRAGSRQARRGGAVPGGPSAGGETSAGVETSAGGETSEADATTSGRRSGGAPRSPSHPDATAGPPPAVVHVRVDYAALVRGHAVDGEICEIPGVGPIPVEVARRLACDSILSVLLTDGVDVTTVAHLGRTIPADLRRALVDRDPTCVVPGCAVEEGLEIDHVRPFADGGETRLANLARLCHWHHYLKTHRSYRLRRDDGIWVFEPPG